MKFSSETMQVLKNFAQINPNLYVETGNTLRTISEQKAIVASFEAKETFDHSFGIYDLPEFLRVMDLVDDADLTFSENHVDIIGDGGLASIKYFFADPSMLTTITKSIKMPETQVHFDLNTSTLNNIRRAAGALGHSIVRISPNLKSVDSSKQLVTLTVLDPDNPTSNSYSVDLVSQIDGLDDFSFYINITNLKLIPANYKVNISDKLISQLTSDAGDVNITYWIALEKNSEVTK